MTAPSLRALGNLRSRLALLLLAGWCAACTTHQQGDVALANEQAIKAIKLNTSTKDDVRRLLGPAKTVTSKADGVEAWTYKLVTSGVRPETYIPVAGLFLGEGQAQATVVTVTFDKTGIVREISEQRTVSKASLFGGVQTTGTPP